jgi:hypothetical protein
MHFHIVNMYKDKEVNKNVKNIFLLICDVKVSDIYFTEFGTALTTILPILCQYCYKYCYSEIYFDKILVSNKANLFIALVQ